MWDAFQRGKMLIDVRQPRENLLFGRDSMFCITGTAPSTFCYRAGDQQQQGTETPDQTSFRTFSGMKSLLNFSEPTDCRNPFAQTIPYPL